MPTKATRSNQNSRMMLLGNKLHNFTLRTVDGYVGKVRDFLFDDVQWVIRYLIVSTGSRFKGQKVLISPISLGEINWDQHVINTKLTTDQVKHCPSIDTDKPVSRQYEREYHQHFGWPKYWHGIYLWGSSMYPTDLFTVNTLEGETEKKRVKAIKSDDKHDPHLRSMNEVSKYHIMASDGEIGRVVDFFIDEKTWNTSYLLVDTNNWLPGRKVIISPDWITEIDFDEALVVTDRTQKEIKHSPVFNPRKPIDTDYESELYRFLGLPYYRR